MRGSRLVHRGDRARVALDAGVGRRLADLALGDEAVAIGAAAAVLIGAGATTIVIASGPSPIEQAGESCAASKPLDAFFSELRATASATPEPVDTADSGALDDLFDGVVSVEESQTGTYQPAAALS